jgi:hypothetical protein
MSEEYGNPYTVMGVSAPYTSPLNGRPVVGGLSATDLVFGGLRASSNARLLAKTATVRLYARASVVGPTSYTVPWFFNATYENVALSLEYRVASGADFWIDSNVDGLGLGNPGSGVLVNTAPSPYAKNPSSSFVGGGLLDLHPGAELAGGGYRPGLGAGESFSTPNGAVTVTVLETNSQYATVRIQRNVADTSKPYVRIFAPEVERVGSSSYASINWNAHDNVAIRTARIQLDQRAPVLRSTGSPLWVSPATDGFVRFRLARGWHKVVITVDDFAGNRRAVTKRFVVP